MLQRSLLLAFLVISICSCATQQRLVSGDILFQDSSALSTQAVPIKSLTRSRWSHCGIYFQQPDGTAVVVDGNGREGPVPWQIWNRRGGGHYAAYRIQNGLTLEQSGSLYRSSVKFDGRPYDLKFAWDDESIYCSELIWKAWRDAFGEELCSLQTFAEFNLHSPEARVLIERPGSWQSVQSAQRQGDMKVVSPQRILESPLLKQVR